MTLKKAFYYNYFNLMKIVGIETSGQVGSVAVCEDYKVLAERYLEKGMRHGRELLPALEAVVKELGLSTENIDLNIISCHSACSIFY